MASERSEDRQASNDAAEAPPSNAMNNPADQESKDPLVGEIVAGRYRIIRRMGEGGMGRVYLAEHEDLKKKLAIKVLLQEFARKEDLKERFLREARAAASIDHENIIDITDFGQTPNNSVFFAMEWLKGSDLADVIGREGAISWPRASSILIQICSSLAAAHEKGIVHRDLKPENIFLINFAGSNDFVKVLDFGIAKVAENTEEKRLTRTGMIFGTPEYMSPEYARGKTLDHRTDIYAVGVIMYEILTGVVPFSGDNFMGILSQHVLTTPQPPKERVPGLQYPEEVDEILNRAMHKDPTKRYQSMAEMGVALKSVSARERPKDLKAATSPRKTEVEDLQVKEEKDRPAATWKTSTAGTQVDIAELGWSSRKTTLRRLIRNPAAVLGLVVTLAGVGFFSYRAFGGDPKRTTDGSPNSPREKYRGQRTVTDPNSGRVRSQPGETKGGRDPSVDGVTSASSGRVERTHVVMRFSSIPPGAEVRRDNKIIGKTPFEINQQRGKEKVKYTFSISGREAVEVWAAADKDDVNVEANLAVLNNLSSDRSKEKKGSSVGFRPGTSSSGDKAAKDKTERSKERAGKKVAQEGTSSSRTIKGDQAEKAKRRKKARRGKKARSEKKARKSRRKARPQRKKKPKKKTISPTGTPSDLKDPFS